MDGLEGVLFLCHSVTGACVPSALLSCPWAQRGQAESGTGKCAPLSTFRGSWGGREECKVFSIQI